MACFNAGLSDRTRTRSALPTSLAPGRLGGKARQTQCAVSCGTDRGSPGPADLPPRAERSGNTSRSCSGDAPSAFRCRRTCSLRRHGNTQSSDMVQAFCRVSPRDPLARVWNGAHAASFWSRTTYRFTSFAAFRRNRRSSDTADRHLRFRCCTPPPHRRCGKQRASRLLRSPSVRQRLKHYSK